MSTYLQIKTNVADWLNRTDLGDQISKSFALSIVHYEMQRARGNEKSASFALANGTDTYALSADYVQLDEVVYKQAGTRYSLIPKTKAWLEDYRHPLANGIPEYYNIYDNTITLYPIPNTSATLTLYYVHKLDTLSDGGSNLWTTTYEDLIANRTAWHVAMTKLHDAELAQFYKAIENEAYMRFKGDVQRYAAAGEVDKYWRGRHG